MKSPLTALLLVYGAAAFLLSPVLLCAQVDESANAASVPAWESATIDNNQPFYLWAHNSTTGDPLQLRMALPLMEQRFAGGVTWGTFRPLWIEFEQGKETDTHFLYPLFNHHYEPLQTKWDIFELIRYNEMRDSAGMATARTFWAFPILFWQRSTVEQQNYTGLFPVAGHVKNFFGYQEIRWLTFPLYAQMRKGQTRRHFLPFPFVQWQDGPGAGGWALWPLMGHFYKEGQYDNQYMLWPFVYRKVDQFQKERPRVRQGVLPFYAFEKSTNVTDWTYVWPFFGWRKEIDPAYDETRYFWPFLVQGRGKKYVNRWAPFYTHSIVKGHDKKWYLWPFIRNEEWVEKDLLIDREQFLYFLVWNETQTSIHNPDLPSAQKTHVWPMYSYWDDGAGEEQFQLFSPLEVFFPHNRVIRHKYSPLFAVYRWSEDQGARRESILWDLITYQTNDKTNAERLTVGPLLEYKSTPQEGGLSLLDGLIGWQREGREHTLQLLWHEFSEKDIPRGQGHKIRRGKRY